MKRELDGLLTPYKVVKTSGYYQLFLKGVRVFQLCKRFTDLKCVAKLDSAVVVICKIECCHHELSAPGLFSGSGGQP